MKQVYRDGTYDEKTDLAEKRLFSPMRQKLKETAGPIKGKVLELAVSTGKGLSLYQEQDCEVTGVDISSEALDAAKRKALYHGINFTPIQSDVECMIDIPSKSMDFVVCQLGFCTFGNPETVMNEVDRVLSEKGKILLLEHVKPESFFMKLLLKFVEKKAKQEFGCNTDRETIKMFSNRFHVVSDFSKLGGFIHSTVLERK